MRALQALLNASRTRWRGLCLMPLVSLAGLCSIQAAEPVDYARDIKPLLTQHCGECHGAKSQKSGLRLDLAKSIFEGGNSGEAVVAGKPEESLLLDAVTGANGVAVMPPKEPRLTAEQIDLLRRWITEGAKHPDDQPADPVTTPDPRAKHWSFQALVKHPLPMVKQADWVRSPLDAFVLSRLEQEGLTPAAEADRATWLRRVTLDLIGLPPTPEEAQAFLEDQTPEAYERVVDRLLASPHYGERMARHWLDLARYADSNGFTRDQPRQIWKYRDWVIDAFNRDLPFDQFAIEQLAGDLLPDATLEQKIATGFHRNTLINEEGGTDPEQFRVESVVDRVSTTGTVFLGLTVGCAQCHDHKYDPISQREFYQFFAFLNNADEPQLEVPSSEQIASKAMEQRTEIRNKIKELENEFKSRQAEFDQELAAWEKTVTEEQKEKLPILVTNALNLSAVMRTPENLKPLIDYFKEHEIARAKFPMLDEIKKLRASEPKFITTLVMRERAKPRDTHVMIRGDFLRPGVAVKPGVPAVLPGLPSDQGDHNRLTLARWLVSPENPLTSRVTVNRLWQKFFNRGIVETENDFGLQGIPPTHPELLDWLALELMEKKWSLKQWQKMIVLSATYRQSSRTRIELEQVDPYNKLYARQTRSRLDAEVIRDVALSAAGLLSPAVGGPSVYPPQPDGVFDFTQDKKPWIAEKGANRYRRGMYTYLWRSSPYPALTVFDFPDANITCTRRNKSNTPLQSLTLANDKTFVEFAQGLAVRVLGETHADDASRLRRTVALCLAREATSAETAVLQTLLDSQRAAFTGDEAGAKAFAPEKLPDGVSPTEGATWTAIARVLMNLDEFITRE